MLSEYHYFYYNQIKYASFQEDFFTRLQKSAFLGDLSFKSFRGEHPLDSLEVLLTRQCPSTSKVNENPVLCIVLDVVNSYQTFSYHAPNEFPNNYKISLYLFMITPVHH